MLEWLLVAFLHKPVVLHEFETAEECIAASVEYWPGEVACMSRAEYERIGR